jgi:predicted RNA-binding Zn-ribbon protein involved in translation (DUF1610 family)
MACLELVCTGCAWFDFTNAYRIGAKCPKCGERLIVFCDESREDGRGDRDDSEDSED